MRAQARRGEREAPPIPDNMPDPACKEEIADALYEAIVNRDFTRYHHVVLALHWMRYEGTRRVFGGSVPMPSWLRTFAGELELKGELYDVCLKAARTLASNQPRRNAS